MRADGVQVLDDDARAGALNRHDGGLAVRAGVLVRAVERVVVEEAVEAGAVDAKARRVDDAQRPAVRGRDVEVIGLQRLRGA